MAQTSAATTRSSMLQGMDSLCTVTWKQNLVRPGHLSCLGVWKITISRILGTVTNGLTLCRPPEKISPFLMALVPWLILYNQLVLLGRSFIACVASVSNRVIARKLERKQKKGWRGRGRGEEEVCGQAVPSFPSPSPVIHVFFALVPAL